jgi:hypothetical protein
MQTAVESQRKRFADESGMHRRCRHFLKRLVVQWEQGCSVFRFKQKPFFDSTLSFVR